MKHTLIFCHGYGTDIFDLYNAQIPLVANKETGLVVNRDKIKYMNIM